MFLVYRVEEIGFENFLFKPKRIISKFYILFNDIQNVINKFYKKKMNIFPNLPSEFVGKIVLFSF